MSYNEDAIAQNLIDNAATPWELAPKALRDSKSDHEAATVANLSEYIKVEQAKIALAKAEQEFDSQSRQNARDGKPLPSADAKTLATYNLANAKEDLQASEENMAKASAAVWNLLKGEKALRDEWSENLAAKSKERQADLQKLLPKVINAVADITAWLGHIPTLGDWPNHISPVYPHDGGATTGLENLVNVEPFKAHVPQLLNAPVAPTPPAEPETTIYITAQNGNVLEVLPKDLPNMPTNIRLSSDAEIAAYKAANQ